MPISYPLFTPATPRTTQKIKLRAVTQSSMSQSPFTGSQQLFEWPAEWWEAEVTLAPMLRADAEQWLAFLAALRGRFGTFYLGDPGGKNPQGPGTSAPLINIPNLSGKVLSLGGFAFNTLSLKAGDYIETGFGYNATRIQTAGGSSTQKYVFNAVSPSVSSDRYLTTCRVRNLGNKAVTISDHCSGSQTIAAGAAETSIAIRGKGDGIASYQFSIESSLAGDSLDFVIWNPRCQRERFDENLIPVANQNFVGFGAIGGATVSLFQGYNRRLFKTMNDATSRDNGELNVDVFPRIRGDQMLGGEPVSFINAKGVFRLADNKREWDLDEAMIYGIQFNAVEAF